MAKSLWAKKVLDEMDNRGMKQYDLAEQTGIDTTTINKLLNGQRHTENHINKICKLLEIER